MSGYRSAVLRCVVLTLGVIACGSAAGDCISPPCALPLAVTVSVTTASTGAPLTGAFVDAPGYAAGVQCNQAPGTTCSIMGEAGTYQLDVGAPGFQTIHRTVVVTGTSAACGCPSTQTQHIDVALLRAG